MSAYEGTSLLRTNTSPVLPLILRTCQNVQEDGSDCGSRSLTSGRDEGTATHYVSGGDCITPVDTK